MAVAKLEIDTGNTPYGLMREWKSIKLDGHDITTFVRGVTIRAHIKEATTAVIEVLVAPEFTNPIIAPIDAVEDKTDGSDGER